MLVDEVCKGTVVRRIADISVLLAEPGDSGVEYSTVVMPGSYSNR